MSIFGSLFGGDSRKDIKKGRIAAEQDINTFYPQGREASEQWFDTASGFLTPSMGSGDRARESYETALGLRGREAQSGFFSDFQSDPGFAASLQAGQDAVRADANARGYGLSGRALKELSDHGQKFQMDAFNTRLGNLAGLAGQGQQAALTGAQLAGGTGRDIATSFYNQGGNLANLDFQAGAATANTRFGIGDLASLISAGAKMWAGGR